MKYVLLLLLLMEVAITSSATATPLDLSNFEAIGSPNSVINRNGTVCFRESFADATLYYANDNYFVDPNATSLSFFYRLWLGANDFGDTLQFNINGESKWYSSVTGSDLVDIDMLQYRGSNVSLEWILDWRGDGSAGTTACISNMDMAVPEPSTLYLMIPGFILTLSARGRRT
jgi:hypothetical protein